MAACDDLLLESRQEQENVCLSRVLVQNLVEQPPLLAGIDGRQHTEVTVIQFIGRQIAREVCQSPIEVVGLSMGSTFFSSRLDPVLDRGEGDENPVVPSEVPRSSSVGQTVLHHQPGRQTDDPAGVVTTGRSQVRHVGVEVRAAGGAVMLGVNDLQSTGSIAQRETEVVQSAPTPTVTEAGAAAPWAGSVAVVARPASEDG